MEGINSDRVSSNAQIEDLIEELTKMKHQNSQLRFDLELLAEKINKSAVKKVQFPPLQGEVVHEPRVKPKNWAGVVAPNMDRSNGANLEFIAPLEKYGVTLVKFNEAEVVDEVKRWEKALIVYVLGATPPSNVMKKLFKRRWGRFGEFKLFLLKTVFIWLNLEI